MRSPLLPTLAITMAMATFSSACGDDESQPQPETALFERASEPTGPRLWLDATRDADGRVRIEIHGAELGEVFGWAAHVRWDAAALEVDAGGALQTLGGETEAATIFTWEDGDAAFGEARRGPSLGGVEVREPTLLATLDVGAAEAPSEVR